MSANFQCANRSSLEKVLPHRGAALAKIDGVFYDASVPDTLFGVKHIGENDPDLDGHFPGHPTFPGYAQDEFACLVAAALIPLTRGILESNPHVVQKIVRYKKRVVPGDRLTAAVKLYEQRKRFYLFSAAIWNQRDELVAEYERIVGIV
jgi:3-hydroxyacyl-[acyl-carrier-protein] dehydratase